MPDALAITIAEAVADTIDAATLSKTLTVERVYDPEVTVERLEELKPGGLVTVMPAELDEEIASRAQVAGEHVVHVAVRAKVNDALTATLDPWVYLAQQVRDLLFPKALAGVSDAFCFAAKFQPVYSPTHLKEKGVFFSVLALTFKNRRAI